MIYYATIDNKLGSSKKLPQGAVKIPSKEEYKSLTKEKQAGKRVTIENNEIVTYESPVYTITGEKVNERDPEQPLIREAPPESLYVPKWEDGEWIENESEQQKADRLEKEKESQRQQLKRDRDQALNSVTYTFNDGRSMQARLQDQANIQTAISKGIEQKWIMEDNTTRIVTVAELQDALAHGVQQAQAIWQQYAEDIEQLMGGS